MTPIDKRYPDLMGDDDGAAPGRAHLVADLDRAYRAPAPAHLRAAIARAATAAQPIPERRRRPRWRRPTLVAAALLAALVAGVASANVNPPLIDEATRYSPGEGVILRQYAHSVNVAASACGYTLRLLRIYADANRVVVGYTLSGPAGRPFRSEGADIPVLADARNPRAYIENLNLGASFGVVGPTEGLFAAYDAYKITQGARALRLRLTLPSASLNEDIYPLALGAPRSSCETYSDGGIRQVGPPFPVLGAIPALAALFPGLTNTVHERIVSIHKPLSVAFTVPVDPARRVIAPRQTVVAGGPPLTLDHVVVTRSETRVYLRRTTPGHILEFLNITLYAGKRRYSEGIPLFHDWWQDHAPATRLYDFWFEGPPYIDHGQWTLVVQRDPYVMTAPSRLFSGGPWIFRFRVL